MGILVTGGAGFIGSHIVDALAEKGGRNNEIIVIDDLSNGNAKNINKKSKLIRKNLARDDIAGELAGIQSVFHFAADPEVKASADLPAHGFENNAVATFRLLEQCRKADVKRFVFASTSTVYGDAETIPTPETATPMPISNYGASKLACEAYCSSYAHCYGIKTTVLRYANIFGERSMHGVMHDFFQKLKRDADKLEILGDGRQEKSYLHVSDCVVATLLAYEKQTRLFDVFNIGSKERHAVDTIAQGVCKILNVTPKLTHTNSERGWVGDVKLMQLDVGKIKALGWKEKISFGEGVKRYVAWLLTGG